MAVAAVALGWQGITVACTLAASLIVMGFDLVGPDLVFGGLTALYVTSGIISIRDGAAGFANTGVLTVLVLYLVAEGVSQTGGLDLAMNFMLGRASTVFWAQVRMMIPVMVASAFLNNTPICALMIPILISWGRRCGISPKKLLIPMSFATVLGGTVTLIGTSTNLVVSGLQQEKYGTTDPSKVFQFFTITPYGLPYAIWGMAYIILFSKWLLPGEDAADDLNYGLLVPRTSPLVGRTAKAAGLAGGKLTITGISKGHRTPAVPYTPDMIIHEGDTLFVTGSVTAVEQSVKSFALVLLTSDDDVARKSTPGAAVFGAAAADVEEGFDIAASEGTTNLLQVNLLKGSQLVGQSVRQIGFRGRFGAAVIAVKRSKALQPGRIGDIVLQANDVLLLSTGALFDASTEDFTKNFKGLMYLDEALARQFTTAVRVGKRSKEAGKTIAEVGLRGINGLFLFEIERADGSLLKAVDHDTVLATGDVLWFAGDLEGVAYLQKYTTLEHMQADQVAKLPSDIIYRRLVQVVVSHHDLVGKKLKEVRFRHTYGAAVLGLHRSGQPVAGNISEVPLKAGDVLVVEAGPEFATNFKNNRAFSLISEVPNSSPMKRSKMWIALALTVAMVLTQIIGGAIDKEVIHLWPCAMLTAGAMLAFKCLSADQARESIEWEVYICIAFAFAVSTAMEKTKLALAIANVFVALAQAIGGQTAALACIYLVTALLSELLTNNAAAAIMYPIASAAAEKLLINPNIMSVAVMLGGSAGWILPYSYQCNLMVYAAGKYRTKDFVKIGTPYHLWLFVGVVLILGFGERWQIPVIASLIFTGLVILLPAAYEYLLNDSQKLAVDKKLHALGSSFRRKRSSNSGEEALVEVYGNGSSKDVGSDAANNAAYSNGVAAPASLGHRNRSSAGGVA
ncbi:hypothetical protein OEZ86_002225 [Tetradesmus obliquus]|nr:hypothetical protein OEZ86_002225 [Tetradesmus obliquus]